MNAKEIVVSTLRTFIIGAIVLGLLLFLPAWTLNYWQAWVFIVVFLVSVNAIGVYLAQKDPALLERRKNVGPTAEQSPAQRIITSIGFLSLIGLMVFPALDHRFGWSPVPSFVSILGDVLVALGLYMNLLVRHLPEGGRELHILNGIYIGVEAGPWLALTGPCGSGKSTILGILAGIDQPFCDMGVTLLTVLGVS